MPLIPWLETYSTHISVFDEEHKRLLHVINELADAIHEKKGSEILSPIFSELIDYTEVHFKHEEAEMEKLAYPELEEQQAEHQKLKSSILEFQERLNAGDEELVADVYKFLRHWMIDHIIKIDKKYGDFFLEKGLN